MLKTAMLFFTKTVAYFCEICYNYVNGFDGENKGFSKVKIRFKRGIFMKFAIGDLLIYGETGVCRVDEIVEKEFLGEVVSCYKLCPLYQSCMIFTPVEGGNVFMRPIATRAEADALLESVSKVEPDICEINVPRVLSEHYDKIIKTHDCNEWIGLAVSIYAKRKRLIEQKKKLSAVDERFVKKAEELIFGELAAALGIDKASVREQFTNNVK